ncbi:MAG: hypothetical protein K8R79_07325 [Calditrichales bacterium]|nr:hypothetical protein [Calditrichales bacterium]
MIKSIKFDLNLKQFFNKQSHLLAFDYKRLVLGRKGISGDRSPDNKESTIRQKGVNKWMVATGELLSSGIKYRASKLGFLVFASGKQHSGRRLYRRKLRDGKSKPKYKELFEWHNKAKGWSGIFEKLPHDSKLPRKLEKEITKQFDRAIEKAVVKRVKLCIK